ncbi:hypothetical protein NQ317_008360 [Molorchus minor]|uniref:Thioredoxin domain-containing protein n=1 Tax=Molorchus minor TaxID=1323400 RepID=A0ABQ9K412_9CUCU|nr:hypothetical protein NQ317_008360 [Molorchus minor]
MPNTLNDEKSFQTAIDAPNLSVVHFEADWVEQCAQVNEVLDALSTQKDFSTVKFYSCPAEEVSDVSLKYDIEAVPTVILYRSGQLIDRVNGADPGRITETVKKHIVVNAGQDSNRGLTLEEKITIVDK